MSCCKASVQLERVCHVTRLQYKSIEDDMAPKFNTTQMSTPCYQGSVQLE